MWVAGWMRWMLKPVPDGPGQASRASRRSVAPATRAGSSRRGRRAPPRLTGLAVARRARSRAAGAPRARPAPRARRASRAWRRAFEQQPDAVDREVGVKPRFSCSPASSGCLGHEHEARHAPPIARARDDPVARDRQLGREPSAHQHVRSSWSSPPMLQPITARSPTFTEAAASAARRALVRAGDERRQRLADVDGERDQRTEVEGHLLVGDDGRLGHALRRSAGDNRNRIPRPGMQECSACPAAPRRARRWPAHWPAPLRSAPPMPPVRSHITRYDLAHSLAQERPVAGRTAQLALRTLAALPGARASSPVRALAAGAVLGALASRDGRAFSASAHALAAVVAQRVTTAI